MCVAALPGVSVPRARVRGSDMLGAVPGLAEATGGALHAACVEDGHPPPGELVRVSTLDLKRQTSQPATAPPVPRPPHRRRRHPQTHSLHTRGSRGSAKPATTFP
eukprot:scaffold916_cov516-Prasinococcus_capsulatus_cf.AAC.26